MERISKSMGRSERTILKIVYFNNEDLNNKHARHLWVYYAKRLRTHVVILHTQRVKTAENLLESPKSSYLCTRITTF
jgi:hypothetical protein